MEYLTGTDSDPWGAVNYGSRRGYISMHYVNYVNCIGNPQPRHETKTARQKKPGGFMTFLAGVWNVVKWILIVVGVLLLLVSWEYIIQLALYAGMFAAGGSLALCHPGRQRRHGEPSWDWRWRRRWVCGC